MTFELGTGVLNWNANERKTDRYGSVVLSTDVNEVDNVMLDQNAEFRHGKLVAVVRSTRESYHVGDLEHKVRPTTPEVDEKIVLGEGRLFFENGGVGIVPDDERYELWLDIHSLYRAHYQTVTLFFEEN